MTSFQNYLENQMSTAVLLSIKPEFANAIFSGDKHFEFRKKIFKNEDAKKVYVYASAPISQVIGHFEIDGIIEHQPQRLWKETAIGAGITEKYFNEYFEGKDIGYALRVSKPLLFDTPRKLKEMFNISHPPQSFRYVPSTI